MKIAIRVDASERIGIGHLRRSLSLAEALRGLGAEVRFVCRDLGIDCEKQIAAQNFAGTTILPAPTGQIAPDPAIPHSAWAQVPQQQDIDETIAALSGFAPHCVVIDSYAFDMRWHEQVRAALRCKLTVIDEMPDRNFAADLLIDQTCAEDHRAKYADCLVSQSKMLVGPRYALLGPAFGEAGRYVFNKTVRSVGIFMGGVDQGNYSATALDALEDADFAGAVEIVVSSANPHIKNLHERTAARPKTKLSIDIPNLAAFFARHDLQIGAGGGATWERCCIGVPTLLVVVAQNQNTVGPQLAKAGVVALAAEPTCKAIATELRHLLSDAEFRQALSERSSTLVDGLGAIRVALSILADTLSLSPATAADAQLMFDWRNDESNRAVSITNSAIEWNSHTVWLAQVLADPARKSYVANIGGRPVGVIRFDFTDETRAEVSLYLDPRLHGIGLGPRLLLAGEAVAGAATIDATVMESNRPSQRIFQRCGYQKQAPDRWVKQRT